MLMRFDVNRMPTSAALLIGLLAGILLTAGCSESRSGNKLDDPELKASMQKVGEMYKAKMQQLKKGNTVATKKPH
jgi:hypothetical protein